jgi:hypothetical protein
MYAACARGAQLICGSLHMQNKQKNRLDIKFWYYCKLYAREVLFKTKDNTNNNLLVDNVTHD